MAVNKVRADYEALAEIAESFEREAEKIHKTLTQLHRALDALLDGGWRGRGSARFYREMIAEVMPAMKLLAAALARAAQAVRQVSRIMKQAEDDSARLFSIDWEAYARRKNGGDPGPLDAFINGFIAGILGRWGLDWLSSNGSVATLPPPGVVMETPPASTPEAPTTAATGAPPATAVPPAATATPVETTMYVSASGVNLRESADVSSNSLALMSAGTRLQLLSASPVQGGDHMWYQVSLNGQPGWVAADYVRDTAPTSSGGAVMASSLTDAVKAIAPLSNANDAGGNGFGVDVRDIGADIAKLHPGIDINSSDATIKANVGGTVYMYQTWRDDEGWHTEPYSAATAKPNSEFDKNDGFANYAVFETEIDGKKYFQVFAHLDSFDANLTQGQQVTPGTVLGTMGCTGSCDGPHVHWEIRRDAAVDQINKHSFGSIWYPASETELKQYFVDPNEFAAMINPAP